jgi:hypothetical protein
MVVVLTFLKWSEDGCDPTVAGLEPFKDDCDPPTVAGL